jgi:hypothetical protein
MAGLLTQYAGKTLEPYQQPRGLLNAAADYARNDPVEAAKTLLSFTPVVGDAISAYDAVDSARKGDWTGAALNAVGLLPFVPAMTAWHGSPHKFDKFSLDKIGTGEGAQAYGHGLYLAESPEVAEQYKKALSTYHTTIDGQALTPKHPDFAAAMYIAANGYDAALARAKGFLDAGVGSAKDVADIEKLKGAVIKQKQNGSIYKTDIPDEAVARFIDWDKPLSQQAPEVQKLLEPLGYSSKADVAAHDDALMAALMGDGSTTLPKINDPMGSDIARGGGLFDGPDQVRKAQRLRELGIPGIRYLDGGSRSAGEGSSNFVIFDPEMIRILERNGQSTGLQPWGQNEWQGLLK